MKRVLPFLLVLGFLVGYFPTATAQQRAARTSSARAAYGNAVDEFKAHKKRNKKTKKKARKSAKRKKDRNNRDSYFRGRPY